MSLPVSLCDAIANAYGWRPTGAGRKVSERVWRVPTDRGEVAVKSFSREHDARGSQEGDLLAYLADHGDSRFRVQALVPTVDGAASTVVGDERLLLTHWEDGHYRTYDRFSGDDWSALGGSLAALHLALDGRDAPPVDTLLARLRRIDRHAEMATLEADARRLPLTASIDPARIHDYLQTCRTLIATCHPRALDDFPRDDPQRPIHNDYNQFNYLFDGSLPPIVLDWESSIGAPREFEMVRCMNHLPLEAPGHASAFVAAYLANRPLRADAMRWAVDTACLMHATKHWVLQGWLDGRPGFANRLEGAMTMVATMSRARLELAGFFTHCIDAGTRP